MACRTIENDSGSELGLTPCTARRGGAAHGGCGHRREGVPTR